MSGQPVFTIRMAEKKIPAAIVYKNFSGSNVTDSGMMDTPGMPAIKLLSGLFVAVVVAAIVLALLIVILPSDLFLALSNYLQILVAFAGALVLLCAWHRAGRQKALLWAGAGFGIWGLANSAWYVSTFLGFRNLVFPSAIDIGLILGLLLTACGLWTSLTVGKPVRAIIATILIVSLSVPALMLTTPVFSLPAGLVTYGYFAVSGLLIAGGLSIRSGGRRLIAIGTVLLGVSFMIYPLREIFLVTNPLLAVIGPFVCAGFALIVLGLLPFSEGAPAART